MLPSRFLCPAPYATPPPNRYTKGTAVIAPALANALDSAAGGHLSYAADVFARTSSPLTPGAVSISRNGNV